MKAMVMRFAQSRVIIPATVLIAAYWLVTWVLMQTGVDFRPLGEILNAARFAIGCAVFAVFASVGLRVLLSPGPLSNADQLVLGILLTWAAQSALGAWSFAGRVADIETSIALSPVTGFLVFLTVLGGLLHLTAPSVTPFKSALSWRAMIAVASLASLIAGFLIAASIWRH